MLIARYIDALVRTASLIWPYRWPIMVIAALLTAPARKHYRLLTPSADDPVTCGFLLCYPQKMRHCEPHYPSVLCAK
jgi:hypothetical protein